MSEANEYRTLSALGADMQIRTGGDGRTISGIAVPWNRPTKITDRLVESFAPGAFRAQLRAANRIPLTRGHMRQGGSLIGRVLEMRDDSAGLYVEARISPTSTGNDTLELIRDGALDGLSIGFVPLQNEMVRGVTVRSAARLFEVAVVPEPAFPEAVVTGVRAAEMAASGNAEAVEAEVLETLAEDEAKEAEEESRARLAEAQAYIRALGYLPMQYTAHLL